MIPVIPDIYLNDPGIDDHTLTHGTAVGIGNIFSCLCIGSRKINTASNHLIPGSTDDRIGLRMDTPAQLITLSPWDIKLLPDTGSKVGTVFPAPWRSHITGRNSVSYTHLFTVQNIGTVPGKEVVQVYVTAPEGALSKPEKVLAGFAKTRELKPGLKEQMRIAIPYESFASYDETGASGFASSYILEKGEYLFHIGRNVRETEVAGSFTLGETVCPVSYTHLDVYKRQISHCPMILRYRFSCQPVYVLSLINI